MQKSIANTDIYLKIITKVLLYIKNADKIIMKVLLCIKNVIYLSKNNHEGITL